MDGVRSLEQLEPYGSGNPKPLMCIQSAKLDRVTPIGGGRHLRLSVSFGGVGFECVFFSHTESDLGVNVGDRIDLAFTPQINEFRFRSSVQLQVTAVRRHDPRPLCRMMLEAGKKLPESEAVAFIPDREAFVRVWRSLKAAGGAVAAYCASAREILSRSAFAYACLRFASWDFCISCGRTACSVQG